MQDIRWQQRFQNFQRAFGLLREAMDQDLSQLNQLEKEGIIQRFEFTFELAWKVLKDKMEHDGLVIDQISPRAVVRLAYQAKYIDDAEVWLRMIGDHNLMRHTYDSAKFELVLQAIASDYLPMLTDWHLALLQDIVQGTE
ncbi:nucleotidyltransferase substrate binding protein [Alkalimonas sp. MEB108]|uniref:Nucleotidyltransferase substrate binding protein n=1 Tax=Alkalimonas cellulosilytica TaxID=3058395 RepID=A0ABU7J303_9GAMM|nr:nucleotidyltransferase substrate binding protein [Alkalimonas sp. MEB108]MEE2000879.1 nucleotidyltransferase substrate binding protein [Alkalimonas sp. MEB108]